MKLVRGDRLTPRQRVEVLAAFIYRWTRENAQRVQAWGECSKCDVRRPYVNLKSSDGHSHPAIPLVSDNDWLGQHAFYVTEDGDLSKRHRHCEPTAFSFVHLWFA
jgi:hypothetical protein